MQLQKIKRLGSALLSASLLAAPVLANAGDLIITNDTNSDSTAVLSNGICSTALGATGVTKAHSTNVVAAQTIRVACYFHPNDCQADLYMTNNCSGPKAATVVLNTTSGITSIQAPGPYKFSGTGFNLKIEE